MANSEDQAEMPHNLHCLQTNDKSSLKEILHFCGNYNFDSLKENLLCTTFHVSESTGLRGCMIHELIVIKEKNANKYV